MSEIKARRTAADIDSEVNAKYGETHFIDKIPGTHVELDKLQENQLVCWGDGITFHFLLTRKP